MQLAQTADSINRANRLLIAGIALAGAGLIVVNPVAPTQPNVQHRAVQLTAGEQDLTQVLATAQDNLTTLESEAATANSDLSSAISTALTGAETGLQNSIDGGWFGDDDGFVFGLFGGSVTDPDTGVTETGSTLQEITTALDQGNLLNAFSYFDTWSLETVDHTLFPLLSPLVTEFNDDTGVTTLSIPDQLLQTFTNEYTSFVSYSDLKALLNAVSSPELSVAFGLSADLDGIATDVSSGNIDQALTDIGNLPSDLTGDLLNGWTDPVAGSEAFTGLLNGGSLLEELLVTLPEQFVTALG